MNNPNPQVSIASLGSYWTKSLKYIESERLLEKAKVVKGLTIEDQIITADVKGTDSELHKVTIIVNEASNNTKDKIKNIISSYPSIALNINLGCFSETLIDLLIKDVPEFFPQNTDDVKIACTCSKKIICSHLFAVYESLEKKINKNPFLIFKLRGISITELINETGMNIESLAEDNKKISNKFVSASSITPIEQINTAEQEFTKFEFPKTDPETLFFILPKTPLFFERKNVKTKLIDMYETIDTELDSILVAENSVPLRKTEIYIYYSEKYTLEAFITPDNYFLCYLKSKGSRIKYKSATLKVPVFNEDTQKIKLKEKTGLSLQADIVFDYFLYHSLNSKNETLTPSAHFLNQTASLALALVKSLSFVPDVVRDSTSNFSIRYIPVANNNDINKIIDYYKSTMPINFMFECTNGNILAQEASYDFLALFMTYLIHKVTFLRASKFQTDNITNLFTKPESHAAITPDDKNIALSLSNWLQVITRKEQKIKPLIKIEPCKNSDDFTLLIDIINSENNDILPLSRLFEEESEIFSTSVEKIKFELIRQIILASDYLPVLKSILDTKGREAAVINLKKTLEVISTASVYLEALGVEIVIPKKLKKLISPRLSLKAKLKNQQTFDANAIFNRERDSAISVKELMNFSYEIAIGDEKISPEEFREMVKEADGVIKYKDSYVLLKPDEINSILKKLDNQIDDFSSPLALMHSVFAGYYNGMDFDADEFIKKSIDDYLKIDEITLPNELNGELRPYQERGFKWLYSNSIRGFGSCMADDMGLGKTIQVISLILKLKEEGKLNKPALVIGPTTLLGNWYKECEKFAPSLTVSIYHGTERCMDLKGTDIVLTTYGLLRNDIEAFKNEEWDLIIIDEAQNIKNPVAGQTVAVKSLYTKTYIAMTGTPVENRLSELWSIFDFINKGYLGNLRDFQQNYSMPIEKARDEEKIDKLKMATAPFTLRRLKSDKSIISDLPEKIIFDEYCYLAKEQAALYEKTLENSFASMKGKTGIGRKGQIFKLITSLKQICNHPVHYTKAGKLTKELSGKTEKLFYIIRQIQEQDEKAIIFTQYKEMGELLVKMMKEEFKVDVPFFHGSLTRTQRDEMVEDFQTKDNIKYMIVSLKAGGTGLNLTAARNVIHYDLWWNPAVEDQATDRTYRIGQTENVIVYRLITLGTFEEKIDEMIKSKKELADLTVSTGEKMISELSDNELREIFSLTNDKSL